MTIIWDTYLHLEVSSPIIIILSSVEKKSETRAISHPPHFHIVHPPNIVTMARAFIKRKKRKKKKKTPALHPLGILKQAQWSEEKERNNNRTPSTPSAHFFPHPLYMKIIPQLFRIRNRNRTQTTELEKQSNIKQKDKNIFPSFFSYFLFSLFRKQQEEKEIKKK